MAMTNDLVARASETGGETPRWVGACPQQDCAAEVFAVEEALRNMVQWYARRTADSNELLPEAEQPVEIRQAMAALRGVSPGGVLNIGTDQPLGDHVAAPGSRVPKVLRELVDELGPFWASRNEGQISRAEDCAAFLKQRGAVITAIWHSGNGCVSALGGFEAEGRSWVVWTSLYACGLEPCSGLTPRALAERYAQYTSPHDSDCYQWAPPISDPD